MAVGGVAAAASLRPRGQRRSRRAGGGAVAREQRDRRGSISRPDRAVVPSSSVVASRRRAQRGHRGPPRRRRRSARCARAGAAERVARVKGSPWQFGAHRLVAGRAAAEAGEGGAARTAGRPRERDDPLASAAARCRRFEGPRPGGRAGARKSRRRRVPTLARGPRHQQRVWAILDALAAGAQDWRRLPAGAAGVTTPGRAVARRR